MSRVVVNVYIDPSVTPNKITVSQYESDARVLKIQINDGDDFYRPDFPVKHCYICGKKPDDTAFVYTAEFFNGVVTSKIYPQMTAVKGTAKCNVILELENGGVIATGYFIINVISGIIGTSEIVSKNEFQTAAEISVDRWVSKHGKDLLKDYGKSLRRIEGRLTEIENKSAASDPLFVELRASVQSLVDEKPLIEQTISDHISSRYSELEALVGVSVSNAANELRSEISECKDTENTFRKYMSDIAAEFKSGLSDERKARAAALKESESNTEKSIMGFVSGERRSRESAVRDAVNELERKTTGLIAKERTERSAAISSVKDDVSKAVEKRFKKSQSSISDIYDTIGTLATSQLVSKNTDSIKELNAAITEIRNKMAENEKKTKKLSDTIDVILQNVNDMWARISELQDKVGK